MKLSEAIYETCACCNRRGALIKDSVHGCDNCKKEIWTEGGDGSYLSMTVFTHAEDTRSQEWEFCSWKCLAEKVTTIETDYFISLPYLHFDKETPEGQRAEDFFALFASAPERAAQAERQAVKEWLEKRLAELKNITNPSSYREGKIDGCNAIIRDIENFWREGGRQS